MESTIRRRFVLEAGPVLLAGSLAVLTVVWPDWIEALTPFSIPTATPGPSSGRSSSRWGLSLSRSVSLHARSGTSCLRPHAPRSELTALVGRRL